jgi:hypothetical protein
MSEVKTSETTKQPKKVTVTLKDSEIGGEFVCPVSTRGDSWYLRLPRNFVRVHGITPNDDMQVRVIHLWRKVTEEQATEIFVRENAIRELTQLIGATIAGFFRKARGK